MNKWGIEITRSSQCRNLDKSMSHTAEESPLLSFEDGLVKLHNLKNRMVLTNFPLDL